MRICLYSEKALPKLGGQELVVDRLARKLAAWGHEPVVLAPQGREKSAQYDRDLPYDVVRHPRFFSTRYFVEFYGRWLARAHRRHRFDLLHCHGVYPSGYIAARCTATAGLPLLITSHGGDLDPLSPLYRKRGLQQRYHYALKKSSAVVALSGFIEGRLRQICPEVEHLERIGNGVDLDDFRSSVCRATDDGDERIAAESEKYVLFLGRLVPRKGADVLIEAFSRMRHRRGIRLCIAGTGRQQPALQQQASDLGLQQDVRFLGNVDGQRKIRLLQKSLCVVMPSRVSEAFGLVALEAFAAGRPVVASDIPGLCELVEDNKTGLLVAEDSPAELARALDAIAADADLTQRLADGAYHAADGCDWDDVARRHVELYEGLVGRSRLRKTA